MFRARQWSRPRLGQIVAVDRASNRCTIQWFDWVTAENSTISITHPYQGRGWGIQIGLEVGTLVLVQLDMNDQPRIVAYLNVPEFYRSDIESNQTVAADEFPYRIAESGEVLLQSKANSAIVLNEIGDILLETTDGVFLEIDRDSQTIASESTQISTKNNSVIITSGTVRRDIRTVDKKAQDILFGTAAKGTDFNIFDLPIGKNPEHIPILPDSGNRLQETQQQKNDPEAVFLKGIADVSFIQRISTDNNTRIKDQIRADRRRNNDLLMTNPALTEHRTQFLELGDNNPGSTLDEVSESDQRKGKLSPNLLAELIIGTDVNSLGKTLRLDYGFGRGDKGHKGQLWSTIRADITNVPKIAIENTRKVTETETTERIGVSNERRFNPANTLSNPKEEKDSSFEWTVSTKEKVDLATLFRFTAHTRGADNKQDIEGTGNEGNLLQLSIDKQGLTKLNIPAATSLGGIEPYRAGQSAIINLDGALSLSIGKYLETGIETIEAEQRIVRGLDKITGRNPSASFVTRNTLIATDEQGTSGKIGYGRKDRSATIDLEGNLEALIGADSNTGQSVMVEADGSLSFYFGKEIAPATLGSETVGSDRPITTGADNQPSVGIAATRNGRSITGRTAGSVELDIGKTDDLDGSESLVIKTAGGNALNFGKDINGNSINALTLGGINITIEGANEQDVALNIKAGGTTLNISGTGEVTVTSTERVDINSDNSVNIKAPNVGIEATDLTAIKGDVSIDGNLALRGLTAFDSATPLAITSNAGLTFDAPTTIIKGGPTTVEGIFRALSVRTGLGGASTKLETHIHSSGGSGPPIPSSPA